MSPTRAVILIIAATSLVRILFAAAVGLCIDESYIAGVSRQFALSYFDHPPLHIWLVGGWAKLIGDERAVILRLPFIAMFAGSTWLMFRLTARVYGERAGLWAALLRGP
jgi:4-amino-4-deoxy-L-arabinose transferase-like glycosyltransferase